MSKKNENNTSEEQRLDKWLWFARLTKTRTLAAKIIEAGKVRVNKTKITKPAFTLKPDDVITATIHTKLYVVKVVLPGERRGPAPEAQLLYEDLTPREDKISEDKGSSDDMADSKTDTKTNKVKSVSAPKRDKGAGRPTKKERRQLEDFLKRK